MSRRPVAQVAPLKLVVPAVADLLENLPRDPELLRTMKSNVQAILNSPEPVSRLRAVRVSLPSYGAKREEVTLAYRRLAGSLRATGNRHAEDVVYALAALASHDLWALRYLTGRRNVEKLSEILERRARRAGIDVGEVVRQMDYLAFGVVAASMAVLGYVRYRETSLEELSRWLREAADDLDDTVDSLSVVLDDEAYRDVLGGLS